MTVLGIVLLHVYRVIMVSNRCLVVMSLMLLVTILWEMRFVFIFWVFIVMLLEIVMVLNFIGVLLVVLILFLMNLVSACRWKLHGIVLIYVFVMLMIGFDSVLLL